MNKRSPVIRQCVITREYLEKSNLFRVAKINGKAYFDKEQNLGGRGVYIKKDIKVIELARKKNTLARSLHVNVEDEIYLSMINNLEEKRD